jgi:hypothetical protein
MTPLPLGILALAGITGGGAAFDLLETTTLTSSASSVTFTGLGAYDYKHLQLRMAVRGSAVTVVRSFNIRFNNDTSNTGFHYLEADGTSVSSGFSASDGQIGFVPADSETVGVFGALVTDILDFSNGSKFTTARTLAGYPGPSVKRVGVSSTLWRSVAAVTSITLIPITGGILAGSRMSLYGVK